jgi:hypothetical protein
MMSNIDVTSSFEIAKAQKAIPKQKKRPSTAGPSSFSNSRFGIISYNKSGIYQNTSSIFHMYYPEKKPVPKVENINAPTLCNRHKGEMKSQTDQNNPYIQRKNPNCIAP